MNPKDIRRHILRMALAGNSTHLGSSMSVVEILLALDGFMIPGDSLILSKGHAAMAQYAIRYAKGELSDEDLDTYLSDGSKLLGSVETGAALGHGLSVGVGRALGKQRPVTCEHLKAFTSQIPCPDGKIGCLVAHIETRYATCGTRLSAWLSPGETAPKILAPPREYSRRIFVVVGDGELNEGACWEAVMTAAQCRLGNLYVLVDANGYQALGATQDVVDMSPLRDKFEVFGWAAQDVHAGNDVASIAKGIGRLKGMNPDRPKALICRTVKGSGISFMANDNNWHYNRLTPELYEAALRELDFERAGDL